MMGRVIRGSMPVLLLALIGQAVAAEVKTKEITIKSGDEEIKAFLAEPEGNGPFPGIVVIQEWWGLTDWIKDNARRLAGQGYVALAPDLYRGQVAEDMNQARQLLQGLPRDRAVRDLKAAVDTLAHHKNVAKDRLGDIGWCMGGGFALQLALHDSRIKECVMCYGQPVTDADKLQPLQARILGIFGKEDRGIPPATVRKFEAALKDAGKQVAGIHLYEAGHGFMRSSNPGDKPNPAYREEPAKEAWHEIEGFFARGLKAEKE